MADRIDVQEARDILQRLVNSHFGNSGEHGRFSIPARPEYDDDLRMSAFITQVEHERAKSDATRAERDEARAALEALRRLQVDPAMARVEELAGKLRGAWEADLQALDQLRAHRGYADLLRTLEWHGREGNSGEDEREAVLTLLALLGSPAPGDGGSNG